MYNLSSISMDVMVNPKQDLTIAFFKVRDTNLTFTTLKLDV